MKKSETSFPGEVAAPKRLLIVVPTYASYRAFLQGLSAWLSERGWDVHVATNLFGEGVANEVAVLHPIDMPRGANPLRLIKSARQLTRLIRAIRPTVVHAHFSVGMLCLSLATRVSGVAYLGTFQGMRFPMARGLSRWVFQIAECFSILRLDQSWVLSEDDFEAVPRRVRQKLAVQEGYGFGCDIEHFDPTRFSEAQRRQVRAELGIKADHYVFIYVGRLTAFKNFPLALAAFNALRGERDDVDFVVVGEADPQHPLDLPDLSSLEGVHPVGWQDDPAPYLAVANTMVFPSEREGMPVCVMEALAMGLNVVGKRSRGTEGLLEEFNGVFFEPSAGSSSEDAIRSLMGLMSRLLLPVRATGSCERLRRALSRLRFYETMLTRYKDNRLMSVALIPDRFASYRYTIFKRLSEWEQNGYRLTIYADTEEDVPGLKLVDASYCDRDYSNGGISWVRIRNCAIRRICFWQTGLISLALSREHQVHVYWGEAHRVSTWISVILSRLFGKKVVFWTHGIYGNEGAIKMCIRRQFYKLADSLLVYSDYGKRILIENGFSSSDIYAIKNSLDSRHQDELYRLNQQTVRRARAEYFSEQDRVLVFVGRLEAQKRLDLLLDVLCRLNKKGVESYKLLIIGNGSQYTKLTELVEQYSLTEAVHFYGACYDDAILAPLLMMADVCVSPGEVGLTAMHSLIYGTPVITHDNFAEQMPEFEVIVPEQSGAFYRFGDVDDLCSKVEAVIALIDRAEITSDTCRRCVLESYTEEYQLQVFKEMLNALNC